MREIKFRAWIEKDKTLFYQNEQFLDSFIRRIKLFNDNKMPLLLQYTGLKDKNGKEIYEGDVLKYIGGATGKREFLTTVKFELLGKNDFYLYDGCEDAYQGSGLFFDGNETCEIIGNIYENPELVPFKVCL